MTVKDALIGILVMQVATLLFVLAIGYRLLGV